MLIMPLIIATNKQEKPEKRIYAATRTFVQEGIALPIALGTAATCGFLGSKLANNPLNKAGITGLATTAGFLAANFIIPPVATNVIHNLPIKEKIQALAIKKTNLDITSEAPDPTGRLPFSRQKETISFPKTDNPFIHAHKDILHNLKI